MSVLAGGISYTLVCWLLGFRWNGSELDRFERTRAFHADIREVLVFERGGHLVPSTIDEFSAALGVPVSALTARERPHPDYIPLETVIRLNPYPQVLRTEFYPYWLSVGYRTSNGQYRQITWYGGEADTTPSLLVRKVTRRTGWGDYFVRYTLMLSKEPALQPAAPSKPADTSPWRDWHDGVQIETLEWDAYRGGSYDGFEEIGFTLLGTVLLTPASIFALGRLRGRVTPSNTRLHPTAAVRRMG
jgi:hypothetical protein